VGKITEKAVRKSVFLTTWHSIFSAELTKTHSFRLFFGDFALWVKCSSNQVLICSSFSYFSGGESVWGGKFKDEFKSNLTHSGN